MAECWRIAQQLEVVDRLSGIPETERRQPRSPRLLIHILVDKMVHRPGNSRSSASGLFFSEQILNRLGDKFDIPNSSASQLHVLIETGRPFKLLINTALDIADLVDSCEIEILAIYKWLNQIQETIAGIAVPGYDSSLCQSEAFESFAPRIVISLEHPDRRSYCPVTALRTKPKVNTVERPLARRLRQDLRDAPG